MAFENAVLVVEIIAGALVFHRRAAVEVARRDVEQIDLAIAFTITKALEKHLRHVMLVFLFRHVGL